MNAIESLNWRAAIKQFEPTKQVSTEDLNILLEAGNLAATSGGMQPFKIVVVSKPETKIKLQAAAYGQKQVAEASHVLVFAIEKEIGANTVDRYIKRAAEVRNIPAESMEGYANSMKGYMGSMDDATKAHWAKSQAFIALGTILLTAASMQIDSCPMEGFQADQFAEILNLSEQKLTPVAILPIGFRSPEDRYSNMPKVRKTKEDFILEIK